MRRVALFLALGACSAEPPCERATLSPLPATPAFAIVTSNYTTSAVALLNEDLSLLTEAWVDSGTMRAGINASLSGDVVFPSTPLRAGELALIDRLGVDVLTRIAIPSGGVLAQTKLQRDASGESAYRANPRDVFLLDDGRALVTRFEPNIGATDATDRGDDLVVLDLDQGEIVERIGLEHAMLEVDGTTLYARPDRLARIDDVIVIGLARLDRSFMRAGDGAIAWVPIPPAGEPFAAPALLPLPELAQCGHVEVSHDGRSVFVICAGDTFTNEAGRRARAGVVRLTTDGGAIVIAQTLRASTLDSAPVATTGAVALPDGRLFAIAPGEATGSAPLPDRAVVIDPEAETIVEVLEAASAFTLGEGTLHDAQLLLPDASRGVLVLDASSLAVERTIDVSPCRALGAREVVRLR